ncbi:MAG: uridine kinase family protein [Christensenellales bacterium]|jgi:dephospho-CoA kinase
MTRQRLLEHYRRYPKMQAQDVLKFLHQSAFGCEHLATSLEDATNHIVKEYEEVSPKGKALIEPLDGQYSRAHLTCLNEGLGAQTLSRLFFLSAKEEASGRTQLEQKLSVAKMLAGEGLLPFSLEELETAINKWQAKGYPPVRHSETFRQAYRPSYRVIANRFVPFLPLFVRLDSLQRKGPVTLAIEGGSASGKTTLAQMLAKVYDCTVFHMDHFFLQPYQRTAGRYEEAGGNVDRERFLAEVLKPLSRGETVRYRRFDCGTDTLSQPIEVIPKKLTVIEGAYSMHPELSNYYDLSVFLDIAPDLQKKRIKKRNSPAMAKRFFEERIPLEEKYFAHLKVKERCDLLVAIDE